MRTTLIVSMLLLVLTSCSTINFTTPQPIDQSDLKSIPSTFTGHWGDSFNRFEIRSNGFLYTESYESAYPKNELDSGVNYFIHNNLLYILKEGEFQTGQAFRNAPDTLFGLGKSITAHWLTPDFTVRKIDPHHLLINRKTEHGWWEVYLLERGNHHYTNIRMLNEDDVNQIRQLNTSLADVHFNRSGSHGYTYLGEASWTTRDIKQFVDLGLFTDTLYSLSSEQWIAPKH
ncbi:MAG: hypothetical protein H6608_02125 [Flavobacteriales bacterium]|nr:hypothetical protein [Bacteroidota bacterium]MCB9239905.1 hypothetical protein [Flavobacteriales bacterium]